MIHFVRAEEILVVGCGEPTYRRDVADHAVMDDRALDEELADSLGTLRRVVRTICHAAFTPWRFASEWRGADDKYVSAYRLLFINSVVIAAVCYARELFLLSSVSLPVHGVTTPLLGVAVDFSKMAFPIVAVAAGVVGLRLAMIILRTEVRGWKPAVRVMAIFSALAVFALPLYAVLWIGTRFAHSELVLGLQILALLVWGLQLVFLAVVIMRAYRCCLRTAISGAVVQGIIGAGLLLGAKWAYWAGAGLFVPSAAALGQL